MNAWAAEALQLTCGDCMSPEVITIDPNSPLLEAARLMRELRIGALPVCQGSATVPGLLGMVTDRDIVVRVIAEDLDIEQVQVGEVMSSPVIYCYQDESPWVALHLMEQHLIRRPPVVDRETRRLVGMVSIGDLSRIHAPDQDAPQKPQLWKDRVVEVMGVLRGFSQLR